MTSHTKAHLGLLATNLFFALNLGVVKYLTLNNFVGPYGLNVIRIGISVILFWIFFLLGPQKINIVRKDILKFILCALTAITINQMLFMKGLYYTYSIHASLLLLITPILITLSAVWILKEQLTLQKIIGLLLGITGAAILISLGASSGKADNILLGDVLIIMSTLSYTVYFVLVKPLMKKYDATEVMRWVFTFGFLMILPLGWKEFSVINWHSFHTMEYSLIFLIAVPGTFLAYLFNVHGIKVLGNSIAGAYIYLQPVFAVIIATIFLKEEFAPYKMVAAILIFGGVYLANRKTND